MCRLFGTWIYNQVLAFSGMILFGSDILRYSVMIPFEASTTGVISLQLELLF
jgi:hypothetical protein